MTDFIVPLDVARRPTPTASGRRPRISRRSAQAGLPTPGGFCLDAEAYRLQIAALGLDDDARRVYSDRRCAEARRHAVAMRLGALRAADRAGDSRAAARRLARAARRPARSAWCAPRRWSRTAPAPASPASSKAFSASTDEAEFLTAVRACWAALWTTQRAATWRTHDCRSGRHRHGRADPAAGRRARVRRRPEPRPPKARCCSAPPGAWAPPSRRAR